MALTFKECAAGRLVGLFSAETALHVSKLLVKEAIGVSLSEVRLFPKADRSRVNALCSPFCGINTIVACDADRAPVAIAVIEHELGRVPVLTDCQARNLAYFLVADKH